MRVGYYAHHHGSGHCRQADKLAALLPEALRHRFVVFTSLAPEAYRFTSLAVEQIIRLMPEDERNDDVLPGRAGQYWQPESLHYSPVGNRDIWQRSWQILNGIKEHNIDLMIIDVSVEVAMLCRTASVPYLYVRLAGIRDDTPHSNAFAGALAILAPYPKVLEAAETAAWVQQKTLYLDFLTQNGLTQDFINKDNAESLTHDEFVTLLKSLINNKDSSEDNFDLAQKFDLVRYRIKPQINLITIIKGYGGHEAIDARLPELRALQPNALLISLGPISEDKRSYVDIAAQVPDVSPFIIHSDLLFMACGLNGIAQAYYQQTPLVVLPDIRPHREQEVMAAALVAQGRAMSWEGFVRYVKNSNHVNEISLANDEPIDLTSNNKIQDKPSTAAQDFMNSFLNYDLTKLWFQEWLLPQLDIIPER